MMRGLKTRSSSIKPVLNSSVSTSQGPNGETCLSLEHVSALGGEDQIRRDCDCHLVERWGENIYIQLTASPRQASADALNLRKPYTSAPSGLPMGHNQPIGLHRVGQALS